MTHNSLCHLAILFLSAIQVSTSELKIAYEASSLTFSCISKETPMWLRWFGQEVQGMALGDKKKSRFKNNRSCRKITK